MPTGLFSGPGSGEFERGDQRQRHRAGCLPGRWSHATASPGVLAARCRSGFIPAARPHRRGRRSLDHNEPAVRPAGVDGRLGRIAPSGGCRRHYTHARGVSDGGSPAIRSAARRDLGRGAQLGLAGHGFMPNRARPPGSSSISVAATGASLPINSAMSSGMSWPTAGNRRRSRSPRRNCSRRPWWKTSSASRARGVLLAAELGDEPPFVEDAGFARPSGNTGPISSKATGSLANQSPGPNSPPGFARTGAYWRTAAALLPGRRPRDPGDPGRAGAWPRRRRGSWRPQPLAVAKRCAARAISGSLANELRPDPSARPAASQAESAVPAWLTDFRGWAFERLRRPYCAIWLPEVVGRAAHHHRLSAPDDVERVAVLVPFAFHADGRCHGQLDPDDGAVHEFDLAPLLEGLVDSDFDAVDRLVVRRDLHLHVPFCHDQSSCRGSQGT